MRKYTYINKRTGQKIYTDNKLSGDHLEIVHEVKDMQMRPDKVMQKGRSDEEYDA